MVQPGRERRKCVVVCGACVCGRACGEPPRRIPVMNSSPALAWASAMLLMTAALFFGQAANADDWRPIPPEELKMTELPEAVGAPAVILYKEVNRNDGISPHEDIYVRIKVLKEEGRKYANVEIPFVKNSVNIHGVKGRSVRMDGSVVPFDGKVMEQTIEIGRAS